MKEAMGEIRAYQSHTNIIDDDRIRLDIKYPAKYDADLVAYNAMGCLAEHIGMVGDKSRKYEVIVQQKPKDITDLLHQHTKVLNSKGYNISVIIQ